MKCIAFLTGRFGHVALAAGLLVLGNDLAKNTQLFLRGGVAGVGGRIFQMLMNPQNEGIRRIRAGQWRATICSFVELVHDVARWPGVPARVSEKKCLKKKEPEEKGADSNRDFLLQLLVLFSKFTQLPVGTCEVLNKTNIYLRRLFDLEI